MQRRHAFEFCERAETPSWIRESIVEILGIGLRDSPVFQPVAPIFLAFCQSVKADHILDLGSGSGEPAALLIEELHRQGLTPPHFTLSDLLPNLPALQKTTRRHPAHLDIIAEPLDATDIPSIHNQPVRTIINTFHHFPPALASKILGDAIRQNRAIFIMESFPRELPRFLGLLPTLFLGYWKNPCMTEKDRLTKALFSYLVPIIGICGIWDSLVSVARIYNEAELRTLASQAGGDHYTWVYRELPYSPLGRAVIFHGQPPR